MTRIFCVANQKGGVGKTTTAINLGASLSMADQATLLIDLDPQCNATTGCGATPGAQHPLIRNHPIRDQLVETGHDRMSLLPGCRSFHDVDVLNQGGYAPVLRRHLQEELSDFNYVLIDCPPSLGALTQTALASADEVLMPIQCEYFAMEGLTQMIEVIRQIMDQPGHKLEFGGIALTMYDDTLELTEEVENDVRDFFGGIVFDTVIPRDVAVSEAPSFGRSVLEHAPLSKGARAYVELAMEALER